MAFSDDFEFDVHGKTIRCKAAPGRAVTASELYDAIHSHAAGNPCRVNRNVGLALQAYGLPAESRKVPWYDSSTNAEREWHAAEWLHRLMSAYGYIGPFTGAKRGRNLRARRPPTEWLTAVARHRDALAAAYRLGGSGALLQAFLEADVLRARS